MGWVAQVRSTAPPATSSTGHVVNGHLRVELALSRHEPTMPVTYVELSTDEKLLVLATLDPLAAMATAEKDALEALLASLSPADDVLASPADVLGGHDGVSPLVELGEGANDVYARSLADLVEPARSAALDKLGEDERAIEIGASWLRPKLGQAAGATGPGVAASGLID